MASFPVSSFGPGGFSIGPSSPQDEFLAATQGLIRQVGSQFTGLGNIGSFGLPAKRRAEAQSRATQDVLSNPGFFQALAGIGANSQTDRLIAGLTAGGRTQTSGGGGGGAGFKFPSVSGVQAPSPVITAAPKATEKPSKAAKGATSITGNVSLLTPTEVEGAIKRPTLLGGG